MANYTWKNAVGGDWSLASNWTTTGTLDYPGPTDQTFVTLASGTIAATGMMFGATSFNAPNATLAWRPNAAATIADLEDSFTLTSGTITLGTDNFNFGDVGSGNTWNINGAGTLIDNATVILDQTKLNIGSSSQVIAFNPTLSIGGQFTVTGGTAIAFAGPVSIGATGKLDIESDGSAVLSTASTLSNAGSLLIGNAATLEIKNSFTNTGTTTVTGFGSVLLIDPSIPVSDTGTITLADQAQLTVTSLSAPSGTIKFADASATIVNITSRNPAAGFTARISGFQPGNTINFSGFAYDATQTTMSLSGNTLTVKENAQTIGTLIFDNTANLHFALGSDSSFALPNSASGILLTTTACFAPGTGITTTKGRIAIEDITVGTEIDTKSGRRHVIWTGKRSVDLTRHPTPHDVMPIRIRAGAFAKGHPSQDLILSPEHAIYTDLIPTGALIPIRHLLNGYSIRQETRASITWHHLELDQHDIVQAENLPVETYLDTGNRHDFEGNGPTAMAPLFLGSDHAMLPPCAPILRQGPIVELVRQSIALALQEAA